MSEPSPLSSSSPSPPASSSSSASPSAPVEAALESLVDLLDSRVAKYGPRPLFATKRQGRWIETSYADFSGLVAEVRGGLASMGVGPGDRIGIIAGNSLEWASIAYAAYGLGAAIVPMYENQLAKEWAFIVRDAGVKVLFASTEGICTQLLELRKIIPSVQAVVALSAGPADLTYATLLERGSQHPARKVRPSASDVACLMYTSGTTGQPKGVVLTHGNVVSNVLALYAVIPLAHEHRTLSFLPWAHALGHTVELHMLIASGASTGIAESLDKLVANFSEIRPTVLVAVPRVFMRIYGGVEKLMAEKPAPIRWLYRRGVELAKARNQGARLKRGERQVLWLADRLVFKKIRAKFGGRLVFAVSGAAALATEVAIFMEALGIEVYEGYGLTETSPVVSANVPGAKRMGSVGKPLPGVRVVLDKSATSEAADDGEVLVYGPNVTRGYHNRPSETQALLMPDGGLRTGDLGRLDQDGFLYITGRIKEQYKLQNGRYVVPAPLEESLKLSPFISNVMIHGENRPHNVALVVVDRVAVTDWAAREGLGQAPLEAVIRHEKLRAQVAGEIDRYSREWKSYERIRQFLVILEDFTQENDMLTPSLKLKRRNVLSRWKEAIEGLYAASDADSSGSRALGL